MEPTSSQFPISHVKVRPQSAWSDEVRHMKLDAFGQTDEMRAENSKIKESYAEHETMFDKKPTVKINGANY
jgi:hypothetical protein